MSVFVFELQLFERRGFFFLKNLCPAPKNNASMETTRVKVAVYFEPDQSVITKITKDAKMTWSDKISWVSRSKYHLNALEE